MFSTQTVPENPLKATFQLSSAASSNLGRSQNAVLGNGLRDKLTIIARVDVGKGKKKTTFFFFIITAALTLNGQDFQKYDFFLIWKDFSTEKFSSFAAAICPRIMCQNLPVT